MFFLYLSIEWTNLSLFFMKDSIEFGGKPISSPNFFDKLVKLGQFSLVYPIINLSLSEYELARSIWQRPTAKSGKGLSHTGYKRVESTVLLSSLSFSQFIELAREEDALKRASYEIKAIRTTCLLLSSRVK